MEHRFDTVLIIEDYTVPARDILYRFEDEFNKLFPSLPVKVENIPKDISVIGDPETLVTVASSCASSLHEKGKAAYMFLEEDAEGVILTVKPMSALFDKENYVFSPLPLIKLKTEAEPYIWMIKTTPQGGYVISLGKKVEKSALIGEFPLHDVDDTVIRSIILKYVRRK